MASTRKERETLQELLTAVQGEDTWDVVQRNRYAFLLAAWMLDSADVSEIASLTQLDLPACQRIVSRAYAVEIFVGGRMTGDYGGEDGGVALMLDECVLQGMLRRDGRKDDVPAYAMTEKGKAHVEGQLLPQGKAGAH